MNARRWIVRRLGEQPATLTFPGGISRGELQRLYPGAHVSEAPAREAVRDHVQRRDTVGGGDDET